MQKDKQLSYMSATISIKDSRSASRYIIITKIYTGLAWLFVPKLHAAGNIASILSVTVRSLVHRWQLEARGLWKMTI